MTLPIERICNELNRKGLLSPSDIRNLHQRWLREAGASSGDPVLFVKWLARHGQISDYQADVLLRRRDDPLVLGPYKVRGRIGRGPMAGVYEAAPPRGQAVAIKVLPPARTADPKVLARFQREAHLAMRLHHPNVIRTFEAGEYQGTHFLVMELLRGETLKEVLLRRGRLPAPEAIRLIYQVLLGLQHLHEQGMVHRDLEPGNLMLVPGSADQANTTLHRTLKILDIGLGRTLFDAGAPDGVPFNLTASSDRLGTPLYCSPEQSADPRQVDIRSDIYSLGCVFFHTLAGQPPFEDRSAVRLVIRHASEPSPRLATLNLGVPAELQAIFDSMLAKRSGPSLPDACPSRSGITAILAAKMTHAEMLPTWRKRLQSASSVSRG